MSSAACRPFKTIKIVVGGSCWKKLVDQCEQRSLNAVGGESVGNWN